MLIIYLILIYIFSFQLIAEKKTEKPHKKINKLYSEVIKTLKGDRAEAFAICRKAIKIAEDNKLHHDVFRGRTALAIFSRQTGDFKTSLDELNIVKKYFNELNIQTHEGRIEGVFADHFLSKGDISQALKHSKVAIKIYKKNKEYSSLSKLYINMASIENKIGNYDSVISYLKESQKYIKLIDIKKLTAIQRKDVEKTKRLCYGNMIAALMGKHKFREAYDQGKEYIPYIKNLKDYPRISQVYNNMAIISIRIGELDKDKEFLKKALAYSKKAVFYAKKTGDEKRMAKVFYGKSTVLIKLGQYKEAEKLTMDALNIVKKNKWKAMEIRGYSNLLKLYTHQHEVEKVIDMFERHSELKNEMFNNTAALELAKVQDEIKALKKDFELEIMKKKQKYQNIVITALSIIAILVLLVAIILYNRYKLKVQLNKKLEKLARTDKLTGLFNRRAINDILDIEIKRYQRLKEGFCILLMDIDFFKKVNDTKGHQFGDEVLKAVSSVLLSTSRINDHVARWGGEEFLIVLPDTGIEGAEFLAERARINIEKNTTKYNNEELKVTMSIGISAIEKNMSIEKCIQKADEALYKAKKNGRNRVERFI